MTADLLESINQEYHISAYDLKPFGPIWRVKSTKGFFALKKIGGSAEKKIRLSAMLSQIQQAGFVSLVPPVFSVKNLPYFECNNRYYQLFQWRQGKYPSFTDPDSIQKCAGLYAALHRISKMVIKPEDCEPPDMIAKFKRRTAFLEKCSAYSKNQDQLNRIDRALLRWNNYFLDQARYALSGLTKTEPALNSDLLVGFCHNDPAPRNIIIENGQWYLIDFELSGCDYFLLELAKLAERILHANDWRPVVFELVIEAYNREKEITNWESSVLPYLICFPQHFWRICDQRFEEKPDWSERRYASRLWELIDTEKRRLPFLKSILSQVPT